MFAVAAYSANDGTSTPKMSTLCSVFVGSGRYPIMFENQMKRNSVAMKGNHFDAIGRPCCRA